MTFRTKAEWHITRRIGLYRSYGILVFLHKRLVLHVPDVFCHKQQAQAFVSLCNREQPELIHLETLIEEAL